MLKIAPSILTADFGRLTAEIKAAEMGGADWIHLDVMDGHFVPNITIGPLVATAVRASTELPIDAHLMIEKPERYIEAFADAGVNLLTAHVETCPHLHRTVEAIRQAGMRAGVALNPATPVESIRDIVPYVDLLLVMSVNPGFGGQKFIEGSLAKIRVIREMLDVSGKPDAELQVDGGVAAATIRRVAQAGASVVVAGSAVYNAHSSVSDNIAALRHAVST